MRTSGVFGHIMWRAWMLIRYFGNYSPCQENCEGTYGMIAKSKLPMEEGSVMIPTMQGDTSVLCTHSIPK